MKTLKKKNVKAFTLIEMLVVLLIISILILLFVPNLSKQKDAVKNTGRSAVVKVVVSQAELYGLDHTNAPTLGELVSDGKITQKQADAYNEYYAEHSDEKREISN
ncbi:competence type IV pilus major pilin ComGC [Lactovum odontotermitis]